MNRFYVAATAVLLAGSLGCGDTERTSVVAPTQSPPAQAPGALGLMDGTYEGEIPSIRISYNGGPLNHITRLRLRQDGPNLTGEWLEVGAGGDDTGGRLTGTFYPSPGGPGTFGQLTLALTSADFAVRIEAKVNDDGSMFVGNSGECADWTCATFWPGAQRDTVTFTRTGS